MSQRIVISQIRILMFPAMDVNQRMKIYAVEAVKSNAVNIMHK